LREQIHGAEPALHTEFPGVLSDLIGDLTWPPGHRCGSLFVPKRRLKSD
jgi:hypothetical protein